ncbi:MAG: AtpZ/AtpI family protein [Candidatus Aminicenantes bacterium]|jgi:ATP synthase protein I|nr:AtpZ/AtpI family protein [Candidatus Aminicenantes bacterium]
MNNRKLAELSSLALMLPSSIAVGLFFGYWLDKRLGTDPWMLMIFTLLGVAAGLIALIRGISKYNKEDL